MLFSQVGLILLVTNLGGTLAGYWADGQLGTVPLITLGGFGAGVTVGWVAVFRLIRRFLASPAE
ncbi:MAG TPA: AtpZ/AtpI family protein [Patescibacteria group bacterium]|nr:AtpZ/AtpI family protein [Patescibacteria group bacterium]